MSRDKAPGFEEIGEALYGPSWKEPMATALGVSPRTLARWLERPMSPQVRLAMPTIVRGKIGELETLLGKLS